LVESADNTAQWRQLEQFLTTIHRDWDLEATAYALANEARVLIGCDRVSVGVMRGRRFRVWAISGIDTVDRRANLVRRMEQLAETVAKVDEPLLYRDEALNLAPQIEQKLQAFLDESQARHVAVIPLKDKLPTSCVSEKKTRPAERPVIGCLVVETFDTERDQETTAQRIDSVCQHGELALANALEYDSLPLLSVMRAVRSMRWYLTLRRLPKWSVVVMVILLAIVATIMIPAEFTIEGRGELQPKIRHDVFATSDGIVSDLRVKHSQHVSAGASVIVLHDLQLDLEFSRVLGEMQTARKRLSTVQTSRLNTNPAGAHDRDQYNRLTAEEEELKELLKSLERQYQILEKRQAELTLRSPIDGQILTWDIDRLLRSRPVRRGQALLTVADVDGPWILEIRVPDNRIGHVRTAQNTFGNDLDVSFVLASDPGTVHQGKIERVSLTTDLDEETEPNVLVTVAINRDDVAQLKPGLTVVPKIYCGRRAMGYVWLHELWEFIQKRILF